MRTELQHLREVIDDQTEASSAAVRRSRIRTRYHSEIAAVVDNDESHAVKMARINTLLTAMENELGPLDGAVPALESYASPRDQRSRVLAITESITRRLDHMASRVDSLRDGYTPPKNAKEMASRLTGRGRVTTQKTRR